MLKFVVIIVGIFLLFKMFKGDARHKEMRQDKDTEKLKATGEMVKDPICGTYVERDGDIRVRDGEKVYTFCSYDCRDKFLKQIEAKSDE